MALQSILTLNNICKSFGPIQALNNVSLVIPKGSVYGILGPNGSGKTTLLSIVLDVVKPNSGTYTWFEGIENSVARKQIGSLLETPNFYHYLTALQNLEINAAIKQKGKNERLEVLEQTGLLNRKDSKFQTFSLGMKQRLAIASALLGKPQVLLLDEPTNGLDPEGIAEIRNLIVKLSSEGITVIMASHMLDEVEKVCTNVAILKRGELLIDGNVNEVLANDEYLELSAPDLLLLQQIVSNMNGVRKTQNVNGKLHVSFSENINPAHVNEYCLNKGITLSHLYLKKKSLENKFIELTNYK